MKAKNRVVQMKQPVAELLIESQVEKMRSLFNAYVGISDALYQSDEVGVSNHAGVLFEASKSADQILSNLPNGDKLKSAEGQKSFHEALCKLHDVADGVVKLSEHSVNEMIRSLTPLFELIREETARMIAT